MFQMRYEGPKDKAIVTEHDDAYAVIGYANVMYGAVLPWATVMMTLSGKGVAVFENADTGWTIRVVKVPEVQLTPNQAGYVHPDEWIGEQIHDM